MGDGTRSRDNYRALAHALASMIQENGVSYDGIRAYVARVAGEDVARLFDMENGKERS